MIIVEIDKTKGTPNIAPRFYVPFEHGAWWAFGSVLLASAGLALWSGADPVACAGVFTGLAAAFVAQDWAQALVGHVVGHRSQARSHWEALPGWALGALGCAGVALQWTRSRADTRLAWATLWGLLGLATAAVLVARVTREGRASKSLALSAPLLAAPALPFGALAFGFDGRSAALALWPLLYFPAATLSAQAYIRGYPQRARRLGPALIAALGMAAWGLHAPVAGALLCANAFLLDFLIRRRWRLQGAGLPPLRAIRTLGRTQVAWSVVLIACWVANFAAR